MIGLSVIMIIYLLMATIVDLREKMLEVKLWLCAFVGQVAILLHLYVIKEIGIDRLLVPLIPGLILFLVSVATKEAIGKGDSLTVLIIGNAMGFSNTVFIFVVAISILSVVAIALMLIKKYKKNYEIAFIPFLFLAVIFRLIELGGAA